MRITIALLLLSSCTYVTVELPPDVSPDAAPPEASAPADAAAERDAAPPPPPDASASDAPGTTDAGPPPPAGTTCPMQAGPRACGDASSYQVRKGDSGIWMGCSYSNPPCPSGWTCAGINAQNAVEYHVCP